MSNFRDCSNTTEHVVFTPYITLRNGRRLYAKQCGKKAFRFVVSDNPPALDKE